MKVTQPPRREVESGGPGNREGGGMKVGVFGVGAVDGVHFPALPDLLKAVTETLGWTNI